jgi:hypothetical protein
LPKLAAQEAGRHVGLPASGLQVQVATFPPLRDAQTVVHVRVVPEEDMWLDDVSEVEPEEPPWLEDASDTEVDPEKGASDVDDDPEDEDTPASSSSTWVFGQPREHSRAVFASNRRSVRDMEDTLY